MATMSADTPNPPTGKRALERERLRRERILLELCDSAVALDPELRAWFIERTCGDDRSLRNALCALLDAVDESRGFLSDPDGDEDR